MSHYRRIKCTASDWKVGGQRPRTRAQASAASTGTGAHGGEQVNSTASTATRPHGQRAPASTDSEQERRASGGREQHSGRGQASGANSTGRRAAGTDRAGGLEQRSEQVQGCTVYGCNVAYIHNIQCQVNVLDSEKHAGIGGKVSINKVVTSPIQQKYMKRHHIETVSRLKIPLFGHIPVFGVPGGILHLQTCDFLSRIEAAFPPPSHIKFTT